MNEELQKELLSILRAMKDGAPDAWNVLVQQRSTFCLSYGISQAAIGLMMMAAGVVMSTRKRGQPFWDEDQCNPSLRCWLAIGGTILALISLAPIGNSIDDIAEGLAPLGRVLEMLR